MTNIHSIRNQEIIENKGLVVGYLLGGYPSRKGFIQLLKQIEDTKLDILEIGFPSINPYADGETIRKAHEQVDLKICDDIEYWKEIRESTSKPIWIMAYKKDFIDTDIYMTFAKEGLIDAIVIPDCTFEEHLKLEKDLKGTKVDVLKFIKPTLSIEEINKRVSNSSIVYSQLYDGPTGSANNGDGYHQMLKLALKHPKVKIFAGFGIDTKEKVNELLEQGFHGTIIGTAMIRRLNISNQELINYINEIKESIK